MQRKILPADRGLIWQIKKVTVAGITGAIGQPIVRALTRAGFQVQVLSRESRQRPSHEAWQRRADYSNAADLRALLEGQDAVISCLGDTTGCMRAQEALIRASIEAGVRRFVPSEFGSDTTNAYIRRLPFFHEKIRHQEMLREAAAKHRHFSYTTLITGLFLDWCLSTVPCIINVGSRTAQIYDGGDIPFSTTRTSTVANAVVKLLSRPESSQDRVYRIHELVTTQNELLQRSSRLLGRGPGFRNTQINTSTYERDAWRAYERQTGDPLRWVVPFINLSVWSKTHPGHFRVTDNEELGLPFLTGRKRSSVIDAELSRAIEHFSRHSMARQLLGDTSLADRAYEEGKAKLFDLHQQWDEAGAAEIAPKTC